MGFLRQIGNLARRAAVGIGKGGAFLSRTVGKGAGLLGRGIEAVQRAIESPLGVAATEILKSVPVVGGLVERGLTGLKRISQVSAAARQGVEDIRGAVKVAKGSAQRVRADIAAGEAGIMTAADIGNIINQGRAIGQATRRFRSALVEPTPA